MQRIGQMHVPRTYYLFIYVFIITQDGSQTYSYTNINIHSYTEIKSTKKHRNNMTQITSPLRPNFATFSLTVHLERERYRERAPVNSNKFDQ